MLKTIVHTFKTNYWIQCILNSYSLMFFSLNAVFSIIILSVTLFTPSVGLCGFGSVIAINIMAYYMGFNREEINKGTYGFNALFLGLAMGYEYSFNFPFVLLFISAILALLLVTVWLKGLFAINNLPFLSFPFIIVYWVVSLAASNFSSIVIDETHTYTINELARNQTSSFYQWIHCLDDLTLFPIVLTFFKTLAGTFFQSSVIAGMLLTAGLLYFSRIAFSLSVIGFSMAYLFYGLFGADFNDLNYNFVGSNFIFLAIALGCFFVIPNTYSYLTVILLTPVLMLAMLSLGKIVAVFQLKAYTLSFSIVCTAFLFALNQRWLSKYLQVITIQYFSAEKTIYKYINSLQRFKNEHLYKLTLPFAGEWFVSQGYDGDITHLGDWSKALDFVIVDSKNNTYREPNHVREGFSRENFYCYNKEIYAPYDGYVYDIINTVEDNDVGDVNTEKNWGNTVILNHLNGLFSQISHIKKESFAVFVGQYITRGAFIATCGNSGRSPEPHIHFQLQTIPTIGAKTFPYPISYFIERKENRRVLRISEVPTVNSHISNVHVNEILSIAFSFLPGQTLHFQNEKTLEKVSWDVRTDALNRSYIQCSKTDSYAYFVNDGIMLYFTDFEGDKTSVLFHFYLAAYRQLLGYYDNLVVKDKVPLIHFNTKLVQFFQDFFAPFFLFTTANHSSSFIFTDNSYAPQHLIIKTDIEAKVINTTFKKINFEIELKNHKINRFTINHKTTSEKYIQIT
jgi:urea transporter/murein DD-endopeptidase MepM/ murein hydrolase activator NlpD